MSKKNTVKENETIEVMDNKDVENLGVPEAKEQVVEEVKESKFKAGFNKAKGFVGKHKGKFAMAGAFAVGLIGGLMLGNRKDEDDETEIDDDSNVAGYIDCDYEVVDDDVADFDEELKELIEMENEG